ncbi:MAG: hypothetical protein ABEJ42_03245 [Halobacteriaceae archaeon]
MRPHAGVDLSRLLQDRFANAALAWLCVGLAAVLGVRELAVGDPLWGVLVLFVAGLAAVPGAFYRSVTTTLPWELVALVAATAGWRTVDPRAEAALYAVAAAAALLVAAELHLFTTARLSHRFTVVLVAFGTAGIAGAWALTSWAADAVLGTSYITTNAELMGDFVAASVTGLLAGVVLDGYVRACEARLAGLARVGDLVPSGEEGGEG